MNKPSTHPAAKAAEEFWFEEGCWIRELLNDPTDPSLSIAQVRVPMGGSTRWHRLAGISERYVLTAGHGRVEIGDLPPTEVGPGDVVCIPAGMRQRIHNTGAGDLIFLALCTPRFERDAYEYPDGT